MYVVTHILAIDGHSHLIAAFLAMPIKNNVTIYDEFYQYIFRSLKFQMLSEDCCTHDTFVLRKPMTL